MTKSDLGTGRISKLIIKYSVPAVIASVVNAFYSIIGRYFIGKYASETAFAGMTLTFPVMMFLISITFLVAAGGTTLVTSVYGTGNQERTSEVFNNLLSMMFIVSFLVFCFGMLFMNQMFALMGGEPAAIAEGQKYVRIALFGLLFQMTSFVLVNLIRAEGKPNFALIIIVSQGVFNILLEYILVGRVGMGIRGAAYGALIAQFTGSVVIWSYYLSGRSVFKVCKRYFKPKWDNIRIVLQVGSSSFVTTFGRSLSMGVCTRALMEYGGNASVMAYGAILSIDLFMFMPVLGLQQGMQPIMAFNHGAGRDDRVRKTYYMGLSVALAFSALMTVIVWLFPEVFLGLFLKDGNNGDAAIFALRVFISSWAIIPIILISMVYLQSTLQAAKAFWIGLARHTFILIPLLFIVPHFLGLNGVWFAMPGGDYILVMLTLIIVLPELLRARKSEKTDAMVE